MDSLFVHLDVKSAYNYHFDSLIRLEKLIEQTKQCGMKAVAITDESVLHSSIDFYLMAKAHHIKPIIGLTMKVIDEKTNESIQVVLLAKNYQGYRNIVKISSLSHLRRTAKPYITINELKQYYSNLIVMVDTETLFVQKKEMIATQFVKDFSLSLSKEDLYLVIKDHGIPYQQEINKKLNEMSIQLDVPLVATNDVHYFNEKEAIAREILLRVQDAKYKATKETNQKYFKSGEEMEQLFSMYPEAIANTHKIAGKCNLILPLKGEEGFEKRLPNFPIPKDFSPPNTLNGKFDLLPQFQKPKNKYEVLAIAYLCDLAEKGFEKRFGEHPEVMKRLRYELGVIISKGFTNYFLIVQDFVQFAKNYHLHHRHRIPVGRGRGSAAGALLSYCLGITDVSPIEYDLMFERFLNPEREDDPDIDLDISTIHRHLLFDYAQKKYGVSRTAKIITFNNYGGKSGIRDIGKVLKVNPSVINLLAENIQSNVEELKEKKDLVEQCIKKDAKVAQLIEYASMIQGLPRNRSVHAAGLVLSDRHLFDDLPMMVTDDKEMGKPILLTQIHKDLLETIGFTKIDLLGLRNLDIIEDVRKMVWETKRIDLTRIPLDDSKTFELYQKGETLGVFQMDSKQMRQTSIQVKPEKINDIFPLIALYRPGSMDMIPIYAKNRENNEFVIYDLNEVYDEEKKKMVKQFIPFEKNVDILKPILNETYGVIVYQEQIIKIVQVWAGFRLGEADLLRRAISKKNKHVLTENKRLFLQKSNEMGRDAETSERLYELIVKFANYGFNVPHSAAYGIISYETAYLKANFPLEFMSASITSLLDDTKKAADYIQEAKRMGIVIQKPNINSSTVGFNVSGDTLLFGLAVVKNVGENAAEAIVKEREKEPFASFEQFITRMRSKEVDKKCIESLIKVGAFDQFGSRKAFIEAMNTKQKKNPHLSNQILFDEIPGIGSDDVLKVTSSHEYSIEEKIKLEESLLCMSFTEYPAQKYAKELQDMAEGKNKQEKTTYKWIAGSIISKKVHTDKRGQEMAFLKLFDGQKEIDVTLFNNLWTVCKETIRMYELYFVQVSENKGKYAAQKIEAITERKQMNIVLPSVFLKNSDNMKQLALIMQRHPGTDEVVLQAGSHTKSYTTNLSVSFLKEIQTLPLKKENITFKNVRYD